MTNLVLQRLSRSKYGTFGEILDNGEHECYTLEPAGSDNAHDTSCILPGLYVVTVLDKTVKFSYPHYALADVPGRENVRMHRGNTVLDTDGCILVGMDQTDGGVWHSADALDLLISKYPSGFNLTVKEVANGGN